MPSSRVFDACREAMWGSLAADSMSMPVHWFYDVQAIKRVYGDWINSYIAPKNQHPTCILRISNAAGSGRAGAGSADKPVIGDVILHDKLPFWTSGSKDTHYHRDMQAGDSSLNSLCALKVAKSLQAADPQRKCENFRSLAGRVFEDYVNFMTTPGSHNDTYAESFHRSFFADWRQAGKPTSGAEILKFAESRKEEASKAADDKQLCVVGGLVMVVPWILHYAEQPIDRCVEAASHFVSLTHPVKSLQPYVGLYSRTLHEVLNGKNLLEVSKNALKSDLLGGTKSLANAEEIWAEYKSASGAQKLETLQEAAEKMGIACYIQGALQILYMISGACAGDTRTGILMNTNVGGENCHRGAALGALLGAANPVPDAWKENLHSGKPDMEYLIKNGYW